MNCSEICTRLEDLLELQDYADIDASANGLQVGPDTLDVNRVAFAVDAAVETIDRAIEWDADLLVTHHGLFWDGIERMTGKHYRRIAPLVEEDIALYAAHLPLDGHQTLGNAAGISDVLGLEERSPFGELGDQYVGQRGRSAEPYSVSELHDTLAPELPTGGEGIQVLDSGPEQIEDIAVITGSGIDWLDEAIEADVDALITGEGKQHGYHEAREAGIHVFLGGHYATETFGVKALKERAEDWGLETTYIEHPTGL
jgi:dinuclear metal center YbgI/SA1388 family protein